jgi:collagenase-like PrtC family protease
LPPNGTNQRSDVLNVSPHQGTNAGRTDCDLNLRRLPVCRSALNHHRQHSSATAAFGQLAIASQFPQPKRQILRAHAIATGNFSDRSRAAPHFASQFLPEFFAPSYSCHDESIAPIAVLAKASILLRLPCFDNKELTVKGQKQIYQTLKWMVDIGVTGATVTNPILLRIIKSNFPQLKVRISVFADVDHPRKIEYWEKNGADVICLRSLFMNRDLRALKAMRKSTNLELELLANENCIQSCSLDITHMNLISHSSQSKHQEGAYIIDHCVLECSKAKMKDPVNFLRSDWIRPEDTPLYEALGYDTFKLVDRSLPTDIMVTRIKAYAERKYDGNLLDLVQSYGHERTAAREAHYNKKSKLKQTLHFLNPFRNNLHLSKQIGAFAEFKGMQGPLSFKQPIYIDNRQLDGFLEEVWKRECRYADCNQCRHCHKVAEKVVRIDETYRQRCLQMHRDIEETITRGFAPSH